MQTLPTFKSSKTTPAACQDRSVVRTRVAEVDELPRIQSIAAGWRHVKHVSLIASFECRCSIVSEVLSQTASKIQNVRAFISRRSLNDLVSDRLWRWCFLAGYCGYEPRQDLLLGRFGVRAGANHRALLSPLVVRFTNLIDFARKFIKRSSKNNESFLFPCPLLLRVQVIKSVVSCPYVHGFFGIPRNCWNRVWTLQ